MKAIGKNRIFFPLSIREVYIDRGKKNRISFLSDAISSLIVF